MEIEKSTDGESWSVIASRHGDAPWHVNADHLLIEADPVGGFRLTRISAASDYATQPLALFRLRTSIAR